MSGQSTFSSLSTLLQYIISTRHITCFGERDQIFNHNTYWYKRKLTCSSTWFSRIYHGSCKLYCFIPHENYQLLITHVPDPQSHEMICIYILRLMLFSRQLSFDRPNNIQNYALQMLDHKTNRSVIQEISARVPYAHESYYICYLDPGSGRFRRLMIGSYSN